jgi:hypothetical protein
VDDGTGPWTPKILISSDFKNGLLLIHGLFFLLPRLDPLLEHHKSIPSFFHFSLFLHGRLLVEKNCSRLKKTLVWANWAKL